ncbi:MAG: hypothetical protein LBE09_06670 [Christensenellaceae bacterium]|nr:hypothetical protein [Christensenellaceae bacterium]
MNETLTKLRLPREVCVGGYKIIVYDGIGVFVEGHRGLYDYSSDNVVLKTKKSRLGIEGHNLKIVEINQAESYIKGHIITVKEYE